MHIKKVYQGGGDKKQFLVDSLERPQPQDVIRGIVSNVLLNSLSNSGFTLIAVT